MKFSIKTKGFTDIIDITQNVSESIKKSGVKNGICLISCPGSTCGITTIEYESGLIEDLKDSDEGSHEEHDHSSHNH